MSFILNRHTAPALYTGFKAAFQKGFDGVSPLWPVLATLVPSSGTKEFYPWLKEIPGLREWIGDRQVLQLAQHGYEIANRDFERTIGVRVKDLEDDQYGTYKPLMEMMGHAAAAFPDELVFELLLKAFTEKCFDGQPFFSAAHPVGDAAQKGGVKNVSNYQAGNAAPWMVLDCHLPLKPFIYQERKKPEFVAMDKVDDEVRFSQGSIRYGTDSRGAAGFGFWQTAFGSKAALSTENFDSALAAMLGFKGDSGRPLGIRPTHLLVPPSLRAAANAVVLTERLASGASNSNYKAVEVIVTPWLE